MVKTLSSRVSDPRPRIAITLQSDDDKTQAQVSKGFVNVQRGVKTAILRVPFGELDGVIELLSASRDALQKHGYDTSAGSDEPTTVDQTVLQPSQQDVNQAPAANPVDTVATTGQPTQTSDNPFQGLQSNAVASA